MSNSKTNMINPDHPQWVNNQVPQNFQHPNKAIHPQIISEGAPCHLHPKKISLRKKEDDGGVRIINHDNIVEHGWEKDKEAGMAVNIKAHNSLTSSTERKVRDEKSEIINEMKNWIKLVEAINKQGEPFRQNLLPELQISLYKWCLFIQQTFYEQRIEHSSLQPTTLQSQIPLIANPKLYSQTEFNYQKQTYQKEIRKLSTRILETQQQIQANRANSVQSLTRITQLQQLFVEWNEKVKQAAEKEQHLHSLLTSNQAFLEELKQIIIKKNDCVIAVGKIEERLNLLKSMKEKS